MLHVQQHSESLSVIARELSLDISFLAYKPDVGERVAGAANGVADLFSRISPSGVVPRNIPPVLRYTRRSTPEIRSVKWWRSFISAQERGIGQDARVYMGFNEGRILSCI